MFRLVAFLVLVAGAATGAALGTGRYVTTTDGSRIAAKPPTRPTSSASPTPDAAGPSDPACAAYEGNRALGCAILLEVNFDITQMRCLEQLWTRESGWNPRSTNVGSGAYGIPQALPGEKMAAFGADWRTNPEVQIRWGLNYIQTRYRTPCAAWAFFQVHSRY